MAMVAIVVGNLLFLWGVGSFVLTGGTHFTALIPAVAGAIIEALGVLCLMRPEMRQTMTLVILVVGVLSAAAALGRPIMKLAGGEALVWNTALISQVVMAVGGVLLVAAAIFFLLAGTAAEADQPGNESDPPARASDQ